MSLKGQMKKSCLSCQAAQTSLIITQINHNTPPDTKRQHETPEIPTVTARHLQTLPDVPETNFGHPLKHYQTPSHHYDDLFNLNF